MLAAIQPLEKNPSLATKDFIFVFDVMCNFMRTMGSVFGFVVQDIDTKLRILEKYVCVSLLVLLEVWWGGRHTAVAGSGQLPS
jgi:hypothetical protein